MLLRLTEGEGGKLDVNALTSPVEQRVGSRIAIFGYMRGLVALIVLLLCSRRLIWGRILQASLRFYSICLALSKSCHNIRQNGM